MLREMVIFLEIHKDIEERRVRRVSRWAIALRGGRAALASEPGRSENLALFHCFIVISMGDSPGAASLRQAGGLPAAFPVPSPNRPGTP